MQLIIGNKNYSSWSLRPWLLLKHFDVAFDEVVVDLFTEGYQQELAQYSPTLRVPVLIENGSTIWDSLAICEYVSENYLEAAAFPEDPVVRGLCRSYCAEMHSGFTAIRSEMPMNCRARKRLEISAAARSECERVDQLFAEARKNYAAEGDYLFGRFSMADCMYAPVVMRFTTYGIELSETSQNYMQNLLKNPALMAWIEDAKNESQCLPDFEVGEDISP